MAKIASDDLHPEWLEEKWDTGKQMIVRKLKRKRSLRYRKTYVTLSDKWGTKGFGMRSKRGKIRQKIVISSILIDQYQYFKWLIFNSDTKLSISHRSIVYWGSFLVFSNLWHLLLNTWNPVSSRIDSGSTNSFLCLSLLLFSSFSCHHLPSHTRCAAFPTSRWPERRQSANTAQAPQDIPISL